MARYAYTIEFGHYHPTSGLVTSYASTQGFTGQPGDTPAEQHFPGRLKQAGLLRREVFGDRTTGGMGRHTAGESLLVNIDGYYDTLIEHSFDGRAVVIRYGQIGTAYPSAWSTVFTGTLQQALIDTKTLTLRLRDRQAILADKPISTSTYAGNNALPDGVEGTAADLKEKRKPRLWGTAKNFQPPCVNTSKLVYQINDGAIVTAAAYDKRVALTRGTDYTSLADLLANAPAAGNFRAWLAGGLIRLGSKPAQLTCDASEGATSADRCPAAIMQRIATAPGGMSSGDINAADVTALSAAAPGECGLWCAGDETVGAVLTRFANTAGAWWGIDALGQLRMRQLAAPGSSPVLTITARNVVSLEPIAANDDGKGLPPYRTEISYGLNHTVQAEVAGSVTAADAAWSAQQWRTASATDATIQTKHPLAPVRKAESLYLLEADAMAEASRQQALHGAGRLWLSLAIRLRPADITALDIGVELRLEYPRLGLDAGRNFIVMGLLPDLARNRAELILWG
jgi:hypothetical protein